MRAYRRHFPKHVGRIDQAEMVESESEEGAVLAAKAAPQSSMEGGRKVFPATPDRVDAGQMLSVRVVVAEERVRFCSPASP